MASRALHRLSSRAVHTLPGPKRYGDGGGLWLAVKDGGARAWVFRFQWAGKGCDMGLGSLDSVDLKDARAKAAAARKMIEDGINPAEARKLEEAGRSVPTTASAVVTFLAFAREIEPEFKRGWKTTSKQHQRWEREIATYCKLIHDVPVDEVTTEDVLTILSPIWHTKAESAQKLQRTIAKVLSASKVRRAAQRRMNPRAWQQNPAAWSDHLQHLLSKPKTLVEGHRASMPYAEVPAFIADLGEKTRVTAQCLEFTILTVVRTTESRGARKVEFDLDARTWTIPGGPEGRMKGSNPPDHVVPLCDRAVEIVRGLWDRHPEYLFAFPGKNAPYLSEGAMLRLLQQQMGHEGLTVHGFRASFRTWVEEETMFDTRLAEQCLAHVVDKKTEAAYNRGKALEKRRVLMGVWADYCAGKAASNVFAFPQQAVG